MTRGAPPKATVLCRSCGKAENSVRYSLVRTDTGELMAANTKPATQHELSVSFSDEVFD